MNQAERRVGTIIGGKWRVDGLLGSGSMAAVYAVTHRNGARAALKILHPSLCTDPAVCERFLGEGYLANSVKHSGIVRVLDDGVTDDGCVFLTMDLLEGDTLEALRQRRGNKIPLVEALELADKLMDVLHAVHVAGIIHRDLKPQNVFVCDDGVVKLLDFGVARVFDRTSQSKLSMFGLVLGTPSYMSPEQALGSRDKVDHRSDIWSFGATLFTALTGETVHLGANVQAKLLAAATMKARSITVVMPDLPPGIAAAIDMALRFKKEDRWQSTDAMRRAFREARDAAGLGRSGVPARPVDLSLGDPSLDESTHVDKGGPGSIFAGFDATKTMPMAPPPEGPSGTFIGIGAEDGARGSLVGNDGSVPPPLVAEVAPARQGGSFRPPMRSNPPPLPPRARMKSTPGEALPHAESPAALAGPPSQRPGAPHPAAVMRRLPTPDPLRISRPDGQEGSIPAYGNTLNFGADDSVSDIDPRDVGRSHRGGVGVWLMAVLLAALALGGIAFIAARRGALANDPNNGAGEPPTLEIPATTLPPPQTSVAPAVSTGRTPVLQPSVDPDTTSATLTREAGSASAPAPLALPTAPSIQTPVTPTPPVRVRQGNGGARTPRTPPRPVTTATTQPSTTSEPAPPMPSGLAPDPFGTPE